MDSGTFGEKTHDRALAASVHSLLLARFLKPFGCPRVSLGGVAAAGRSDTLSAARHSSSSTDTGINSAGVLRTRQSRCGRSWVCLPLRLTVPGSLATRAGLE